MTPASKVEQWLDKTAACGCIHVTHLWRERGELRRVIVACSPEHAEGLRLALSTLKERGTCVAECVTVIVREPVAAI